MKISVICLKYSKVPKLREDYFGVFLKNVTITAKNISVTDKDITFTG